MKLQFESYQEKPLQFRSLDDYNFPLKIVTNNRLQESIDKHRTDITKILQELCKVGYLVSENKSRWTTYHLNTDFMNCEDTSNEDTSNEDTSNEDTSNEDSSKSDKLAVSILAICEKEFLSIEEIAKGTNRSVRHLKNRIIPSMVKQGKLIRLYPNAPNHPQQKYKANQ